MCALGGGTDPRGHAAQARGRGGRARGRPETGSGEARRPCNAFNGTIKFIRIDLGNDSHDHLIDPAMKAQLNMTRQ